MTVAGVISKTCSFPRVAVPALAARTLISGFSVWPGLPQIWQLGSKASVLRCSQVGAVFPPKSVASSCTACGSLGPAHTPLDGRDVKEFLDVFYSQPLVQFLFQKGNWNSSEMLSA